MDFDNAKENIQPLAQGRNASILQASLKVDSSQELLAQRRQLEKEIHNYSGEDPLSAWFNYIDWIEQSFPSGGKESGLHEVLAKCLSRFEGEERYNQDRRMIKLYIKYIDCNKDPAECYQQLFNAGIGTMVSDFYIAWAYCYDQIDSTRKADEIFRRGIACRAQPLEDLQEAHQHFGFTVAQRLMHKDDDNIQQETNRQMQERRMALSSLRGHRRKQMVGSIRTGVAVKSAAPGVIKCDGFSTPYQRNNVRVSVFKDENVTPNLALESPTTETTQEEGKSVVRSIIDAQRDQENRKEPGPWNKPHAKGKLFGKTATTNELGFEIHEDDQGMNKDNHLTVPISMTREESKFDKPMKLPSNFCRRNRSQIDWIAPVTTEERPDKNTIPQYNKCKLYPRPNVEFQPEEYKAYCVLKKRGIENKFTVKRDIYLGQGPLYNLRQYPHFAKQSITQKPDSLDEFYSPPQLPDIVVAYNEIYNSKEKVELSFEEILALRIRRNETIIKETDMEETVCVPSEKIKSRKSFFPMRKSIAPCSTRASSRKHSLMPCTLTEENESRDDGGPTTSQHDSLALPIFENRSEIEFPKVLSKIQRGQHDPQYPSPKELEPKTSEITNTGATPKIFAVTDRERREEKEESIRQMTSKSSSSFATSEDRAKHEPPKVSFNLVESKPRSSSSDDAAKPVEPFQIYQEDGFISKAKPSFEEPTQKDSDFQFKTPALPPSANSTAVLPKSNKIAFEIFEDKTNNAPKPEFGCGTGGYFDADETCSTQTFNIFLKAQSVSTPKMKPEPQRLFGNILKETKTQPPTTTEFAEEEPTRGNAIVALNPLSDIGDENSPAAATLFSPQRKQLSTILETSEHGTTQSTHTTGATTKSTISSPEFDQESQTQHQPTLDTVRERTMEDSTTPASQQSMRLENQCSDGNKIVGDNQGKSQSTAVAIPVVTKLAPASSGPLNFSIFEDTMGNKSNKHSAEDYSPVDGKDDSHINVQPALVATPGVTRFQPGTAGRLDFSIFEDSMGKNQRQHVGNFSRLEEKEDTEAGYVIKPIRFQEDKTETISKMLLAPQQAVKYQEDKTETITKMLFAPSQAVKFQEDKTETISKMLFAPPPPARFEDDRTETITKLMLAPPQPSKGDDGILPKLPIKDTSIAENKNQDNFFEFFSQSPPKPLKSSLAKPFDKATGLLRTATESRTPLTQNSKRVCDMDTPDMQKTKCKPTALFPEANTKSKSVLRDSFMPDFSVIEDSQPVKSQQQSKISKPKSVLRDSFIPDFSLIEDSQPQKPIQQQITKKTTDESFLPNFSHIPETQPQPHTNDSIIPDSQPIHSSGSRVMKSNSIKSTMQSFLPNFSNLQVSSNESMIPDSQPSKISSSVMNQISIKATAMQSSYLSDFSIMPQARTLTNSGEGQPTTMKNILTDTFMKDFSEIKEPPPIPIDVKEMTMIQPSKNNSTLKFLEESINQKPRDTDGKAANKSIVKSQSASSSGKLSFLPPNTVKSTMETKKSGDDKFFELNAETEMFGTNISMIKNSTWLPNHGPMSRNLSQIQEASIHIKDEQLSSGSSTSKRITEGSGASNVSQTHLSQSMSKRNPPLGDLSTKFVMSDLPKPKLSFLDNSNNMVSASRFSIDVSQSEWAAIHAKKQQQQQQQSNQSKPTSTVNSHNIGEPGDDDDFGEMSIYYKNTPKTPKAQVHIWEATEEEDVFKTPTNNRYMHAETDLNQTHQVIENICVDPNVNPFHVDLINAFLEQIQFTTYIQGLTNCMMVRTIHRLKASSRIRINSLEFEVVKLIGEGAYGAVFCGKQTIGGKQIAMKQENPANLWEFYICLEIQDRIIVDEMLPAYMSIDHALIGNNSSILISQFSPYGSLITVCNKIKKHTMKNVDEYVVMLMANELLEIIDHLHAVAIIHADIKADNFLLMNKLKYPSTERCLQLIDFGVSIDMKQFKPTQTFSYVHSDNSFKCVEMREQRPWTYQLDLYGLAGVLHVLLFGKYMDIEKKPSGIWMHKTHTPRYFNRNLWDAIFKSLLNIRDCNSMPNLQNLRAMLKEEIEEKEKYVLKMVNEFNRALSS